MYGIAGERRLTEWTAPWLPGYENSAPVRIGNAAHSQLQLDVFGEIMDVHHQARRSGLSTSSSGWEVQLKFLEHLKTIWKEPDQGIWEVRGAPQHFTHSKVMAWVAFDRSIKSAETFGLEGPDRRMAHIARGDIRRGVCQGLRPGAWHLRAVLSVRNSSTPACCCMPSVGFLPVSDPRVEGTVAAIERRLLRDGFVMRYDTAQTDDGLSPGEGAFPRLQLLAGRRLYAAGPHRRRRAIVPPARSALRNDVGLLSEEYDPRRKRLVGNFPQAFSHMALVNSAYNLTRVGKAGRAARAGRVHAGRSGAGEMKRYRIMLGLRIDWSHSIRFTCLAWIFQPLVAAQHAMSGPAGELPGLVAPELTDQEIRSQHPRVVAGGRKYLDVADKAAPCVRPAPATRQNRCASDKCGLRAGGDRRT